MIDMAGSTYLLIRSIHCIHSETCPNHPEYTAILKERKHKKRKKIRLGEW